MSPLTIYPTLEVHCHTPQHKSWKNICKEASEDMGVGPGGHQEPAHLVRVAPGERADEVVRQAGVRRIPRARRQRMPLQHERPELGQAHVRGGPIGLEFGVLRVFSSRV